MIRMVTEKVRSIQVPYVPSKKTDGKSDDREQLDIAVEEAALMISKDVVGSASLISAYKGFFDNLAHWLVYKRDSVVSAVSVGGKLGSTVLFVAQKYGYEGAFLGELNYAVTRFIQRVPQIKVESGAWQESDELRYWLYASTVEALIVTAQTWVGSGLGVGGVFEDIKDEYKRRVNASYEAAQIIRNGDCYDTPYFTRLVEVRDSHGALVGHQEVMVRRGTGVSGGVLNGHIVLVSNTASKKA